ncbi:LytTR family DNA-binding domain-containing protein [Aquabacterium sp. A7-Y]|uniref:LytR/AlgR family response regulator transcription factor n=1 Tax=Aquabacterium sp. A7-Y TaxID=1349605 RepID=UPI00223E04C6|nr:LytTR family DNA-binding domain-containing protein [Aquabacterium sp. A7-Y]MCW7539283.1 LytTR family DNA-binding domain-containing protein [Aquabacterium sp. A7-Y]
MKPTALIAEDEPLLARALQAELARQWPELEVVATVGHGAAAVDAALALRPQVCFLDIRMPGLSGLEAAQALAEDWHEDGSPLPLLVFVTAYDQYALQAFDAAAVDYLLKPVEPERLARCCERLRAALQGREASSAGPDGEQALAQLRSLLAQSTGGRRPVPALQFIQAGVGDSLHMVPIDDVLYFEAADKYVRVVTAGRDYLIRTSLRELLPQLDAQKFWQVHRGTVVRASAIHSVTRDENGKLRLSLREGPAGTLTVSRLYASLFKSM